MKLDIDAFAYFNSDTIDNNFILPCHRYVISCQRFRDLITSLNKLASHYKLLSNELILQISRVTNCKTISLSQLYNKISITPSSNSLLHCLIDIFRDSIIVNYEHHNLNILNLIKFNNTNTRTCKLSNNDEIMQVDHINKSINNYKLDNNVSYINNEAICNYIKLNELNISYNNDIMLCDNGNDINNFNCKRKISESSININKKRCVNEACIKINSNDLTNALSGSVNNDANVNNRTIDDILLHTLKNPSSIFKSILLKEIFNGINDNKLNLVIANSRIFIPEIIIYLSNQHWIKCLLLKDESIISKYNVNDLITSIDKSIDVINQMLNGIKRNDLKSIYFQACGKVLSKDTILTLNNNNGNYFKKKRFKWSNIYIPRSRMMYRSSFNNFGLPTSSLFKFKRLLSKTHCRILLNNVLFNNDLMDDKCDNEVVWKIKRSIESLTDADDFKSKKKSLISELEDHFYEFIVKLHNFDFKYYLDKHCPKKIIYLNRLVELSQIPSLNYSINVDNVVSFIQDVINNLINDHLLGNQHNKKTFLKTCCTIVKLNRNETLNIDRLIRNIKAKNCKWADPNSGKSYNRILVIRDYLSKLIYILHKHITCPLLWSCFYITESGNSINKLYYFRKSDWNKLERIADSHLSNSNYKISDKSIEYNKIRWVPKNKGMRPIWNLSNLPASSEFIESLNNKSCQCSDLSNNTYKCFKCYTTSGIKKTDKISSFSTSRNTFLYLPRVLLSFLCRHKSKLMGSSVMGYNQVYKRLNNWWYKFSSICKKNLIDCKLYIIVADLSMCYESILHENLINVINNLPIPRRFFFTRGYCRTFTRLSLSSKFLNCFGKRIDLIDSGTDDKSDNWLKKFRRQSILKCLIGGGVCIVSGFDQNQISVTRQDINELIETLLKTLTVTLKPSGIGKVIMRQTCGIPQGCCISSFLCSLYMASKDKSISKLFTSNVVTNKNKITSVPNLLLRWIDDFIFISANKDDAMEMSKILLDAKVFDAKVNLNKLNANFEPFNHSKLEWLGMSFSFNFADEKINIEMEPWRNLSNVIRDSFSFKITSNDFMQTMLIDRLYGYLSNRLCHGLFSCNKINSNEYIVQNSYVIMRICMLKLICGLNTIVSEFGGFINYKFIINTIFNLIDHIMTLISKRCRLYGNLKYFLQSHLLTAPALTIKSFNSNNIENDKRSIGFKLNKLLQLYHKGIKQSNMPKILKRIVLYGHSNKIYSTINNVKRIESKFEGKWPICYIDH